MDASLTLPDSSFGLPDDSPAYSLNNYCVSGLTAIGQAAGVIERVSTGDAAIVDAESGQVHLRPSPEVVNAYSDKVRFRAEKSSSGYVVTVIEPAK